LIQFIIIDSNMYEASQDPLTDKAAEHICFLADVNQLYDTSLGLYNLDLALLIAQQSQKVRRISYSLNLSLTQ
jgi:hypothetical protein